MKKNKTYFYDYNDVIKKDVNYKIYCNRRKLKKILKKYYKRNKKGNISIHTTLGYYDISVTKKTFNEKDITIWVFFMFKGVDSGKRKSGDHVRLFCNNHEGNLHSWHIVSNLKNIKIYNSLFYLEK